LPISDGYLPLWIRKPTTSALVPTGNASADEAASMLAVQPTPSDWPFVPNRSQYPQQARPEARPWSLVLALELSREGQLHVAGKSSNNCIADRVGNGGGKN
jgi:hypothetical protein